jgi:hypothetical protein
MFTVSSLLPGLIFYRYLKAISQIRSKFAYVGDKSGFSNNSGTTISGILSSIEEALKITNDIVDKLRDSGCFAYDN